ncbi:Carbon-nitrogen hydrolase [Penicillium alfredii]|uniref:Carbon-nitrogen hydrolase n=1 Tax=Penicillium alfredii TaxID=1506179 RepID=A0A9W9KGM9_9EURO|nr:Carbon-nitrogen hydrolase [Penicillium alfredii]KAJ5104848.1 Carbon-nitrogen hydrolase [Penicillium alfredii]
MRIATLQFAAKLGDVEGNIARANELLKSGKAVSVGGENLGIGIGVELLRPDLLVLSEMALTGYNFPSLGAIKPYLEPAGKGPCASWARDTAKRLRCKVCVGYPEIEADAQDTSQTKYYNSLLVVDENGDVILNYRKSFLYFTDETWAAEGDVERGFHELSFSSDDRSSSSTDLVGGVRPSTAEQKERRIATSFGICMDINPYKFEAPFTAWEFANRVLDSKSQLVILSMAWLTLLTREELEALKGKPEMDTFNYWLQRFWPLLKKQMKHDTEIDDTDAKRIVIVFANRAGEEPPADETKPPARYAGTSTIMAVTQRPLPATEQSAGSSDDETLSEEKSETASPNQALDVKILCWDMLGAAEEGICFADTTADPKMVFELKKASG